MGGRGGESLSRRNQTHGTKHCGHDDKCALSSRARAQMSESACCQPLPPPSSLPTPQAWEEKPERARVQYRRGEVLFFGATVGAGWWDGKADGWVSIPADRFVCERLEPYLGAGPPPKALPPRPRATFSLRSVGKVNVPTLAEKDQGLYKTNSTSLTNRIRLNYRLCLQTVGIAG